jgi:hypothetical protein
MIRLGKRLRPDSILVLGDFLDCFSVSAHDKDPRRLSQFSAEVKDAREGLEELELLGAEHLYFDEGNHEYRLKRYLMTKAPALMDTVSIPDALRLREHGWKFTKYMQHSRIGKLYHTHEAGHAGIHAVHATGHVFNHSVVFGHVHRLAVSYFGSVTGERHFSASLGWLGDAAEADYMPEAKKSAWQLGFGVVRVEPKSGNVHLQPIPIVDYRCILDGKVC